MRVAAACTIPTRAHVFRYDVQKSLVSQRLALRTLAIHKASTDVICLPNQTGRKAGLPRRLVLAYSGSTESLFGRGLLLVGISLGILQMPERESKAVACEGKVPQDTLSSQQPLSKGHASTATISTPPSDRVCGKWCAHASTPADTACVMDQKIIPCRGEWCRTTAGRWSLFAMGSLKKKRVVPCELYSAGVGYPIGGVPCDPACLGDEIKAERYPAPTGYGVLCKPGTCIPSASPRAKCGEGLGSLQCPCNWFGSECEDEWTRVVNASRQRVGDLDQIILRVPIKAWRKVLKDYRPGSVVRIQTKERSSQHREQEGNDTEDGIFEAVCAIAQCNTPGEIKIIVAPPDPNLRWEVRRVAELLRATPSTVDRPSQKSSDHSGNTSKSHYVPTFYVNPAISGFYNSRYKYLMDEVERRNRDTNSGCSNIESVVVVATGSGLSGALSAVEALVNRNQSIFNKVKQNKDQRTSSAAPVKIHFYYGLRDVNNLPYADLLEKLVQSGSIQLTLVESKEEMVPPSSEANTNAEGKRQRNPGLCKELCDAVARGEAIKAKITAERMNLVSETENEDGMRNGKVYVQHALQHDLTQTPSSGNASASLLPETMAVVVCGRMQMTDGVREVIKKTGRPENEADNEGHLSEQCQRFLDERLFANM